MKKMRNVLSECTSYVVAFILVVIIASVLIVFQGANPIEAFGWMIKGAVGSKSAIASSIRWSTPGIIASTAAVIAQKSGINNLGIEGQLYFGALTTAVCAVYVQGPALVVMLVSILAGALAGMLYSVIPAILRLFFNIDEMLTSLMLNYAAIQFTEFITMQVMGLDSNTNPDMIATAEMPDCSGSCSRIRRISASLSVLHWPFWSICCIVTRESAMSGSSSAKTRNLQNTAASIISAII